MEQKVNIFVLFFLTVFTTHGQELVSSSGGFYSNSNGSLAWSVGEAIIATISDGSDTLTQGFHQSRYTFTIMNESDEDGVSVKVFPNPSTDEFAIDIVCHHFEGLRFTMSDQHGKLIIEGTIHAKTTIVDMRDLSAQIYFLSVFKNNCCVKTIQIVKNH